MSYVKLALDIILETFGSTCHACADALVGLGPSSLQELARYLSSNPLFLEDNPKGIWKRVQAALLTLICHDTLELSLPVEENRRHGFRSDPGSAIAFTLRYEFKPIAVTRILRYPHYLELVRKNFGGPGVAVIQSVLIHGPWTRAGALEEAARILVEVEAHSARVLDPELLKRTPQQSVGDSDQKDSAQKPVASAIDRVSSVWDLLIASALLVPHEGLGAFPPYTLANFGVAAGQKRPRSKNESLFPSSKASSTGNAASSPKTGKKFPGKKNLLGIIPDESDEEEEDDEEEDDREDNQGEGGSPSSMQQQVPLYRFGWEAATRRTRNGHIVEFVGNLLSREEDPVKAASHIVDAMLRLSEKFTVKNGGGDLGCGAGINRSNVGEPAYLSQAPSIRVTNSRTSGASLLYAPHLLEPTPTLSGEVILKELQDHVASTRGPGGDGEDIEWTLQLVQNTLECLQAHPSCTVMQISDGGGWKLHIRAALFSLQQKTVETWVYERFGGSPSGTLASRILRTLLNKGMLEEKTVSDLVLADARTVRVYLWKMLGEGLLTTQEVPKRPDRNPQFASLLFCAVRIFCLFEGHPIHIRTHIINLFHPNSLHTQVPSLNLHSLPYNVFPPILIRACFSF